MPFSAMSLAEQSLLRVKSSNPSLPGATHDGNRRSNRIMRSLVESTSIEEDGPLHENGSVLAEAEAVVILADHEELRIAGIEMRVDAVEHGPIAGERRDCTRFAACLVDVDGIDRDVAAKATVIGIMTRQHLDHLGKTGGILLVPRHLLADLRTVGLDDIGEVRGAKR